MNDYKERVVAEKSELDIKIEKLRSFLASEKVATLVADDILLLTEQLRTMNAYSKILRQRIDKFEVPTPVLIEEEVKTTRRGRSSQFKQLDAE